MSLASLPSPGDCGPRCQWCSALLTEEGQLYCSKRCRQTAWRVRKLAELEGADGRPRRIGYGDPPYPGTSRKYYRDEPTYAGEVDHAALLSQLQEFDGWALSTSQKALRDVLPLAPAHARVASWGKPIGASSKTRGPHNTWEPVIYVPARYRQPGASDSLWAMPARGGGTLPGRKPIKFVMWLFALLGMAPGDELFDLFPGSKVVTRCWHQVSRGGTPATVAAGAGRRRGSRAALNDARSP